MAMKSAKSAGIGVEGSRPSILGARFVAVAVILSSLLLTAPPASAAQLSRTLKNVAPTPHRAPVGASMNAIAASIADAAQRHGWEVTEESPDALRASLWVRGRHHAIVRIGFDETNYWIDYVDSENLNYSDRDLRVPGPSGRVVEGPRIHPNYNRWVETLARAIEATTPRTPLAREEEPGPPPVSTPRISVAEELEKLDSLRERGVLTQEEFDQEKAKLLSR